MKRNAAMLAANPLRYTKAAPPPRNMPHCNPKWLRKKRRIELEGEARDADIKAENEQKILDDPLAKIEEAARKAKLAAVEAYLSIASGLRERARRLKGIGRFS